MSTRTMSRPRAEEPGVGRGLTARDVAVRYAASRTAEGVLAVAGVSLDVAPGEILALLGPSGCGKSTLLRAIIGLEPLAAGTVAWDGVDLAGVPVHRREFGLMFQDGQLFAHRDVAGNVAYGIGRVPRRERDGRVTELLDAVGLHGYGRRAVGTLSGGERQRVALARALAPRPRLLLLDEPLSALDRALRERLAADLREVLVATETTAVFVTHDHDEAFAVADRVAVMDAGRLLRVAPPVRLWADPGTRRVAEFLGYQAFVPVPQGWGVGEAPDGGPTPNGGERLLAIGPRGLVVTGEPANGRDAWRGVVAGVGLRRGVTEIQVDVELPGVDVVDVSGSGAPVRSRYQRVVAVVRDYLPVVGDAVAVILDPIGCAVVTE